MTFPNKKDLTESDKEKLRLEAQQIEPMSKQDKQDYMDSLDSGHRYLLVSVMNELRGVQEC